MPPKTVLYYGSEEPVPEGIRLRAGSLTMIFEPEIGFLRRIRMGDREVLRGIYAALRDRNWDTIAPKISNLKIETAGDAFHVTFEAECKKLEVNYSWSGTITGDQKSGITYTMQGVARSTFLRSRIGFCVLHPIKECAGKSCIVEKVDGNVQRAVFPYYISPHQPFMEMRAISHEVVPGLMAEARFEGEVFEMEDQRNWTDASFKTYCTPLRLPFPVEVREGTTLNQSVKLKLRGEIPAETSKAQMGYSEVLFKVGEKPSALLPLIGLGVASHGQPLSRKERKRLKTLNLAHLRVDLNLSKPGYGEILNKASAEANELSVSLEVALFITDKAEDELNTLIKELETVKPSVSRWLIFHLRERSTTERWIQLTRRYLEGYDPKAKIGGGTNGFFTELNRGRPPTEAVDFICYSINPQVHAFDNATMVENLEGQAWTVETAQMFLGDVPLAITPVTLKPRFYPEHGSDELPPNVDLRQMSLFGACWTLGSLKHLSESGVHSVTYYETTGWRGVSETESGSPVLKFHSIQGAVFPLYQILADVGEFTGGIVVPSVSSDPLRVEGMALNKGGRIRILLANMEPQPQYVRLVCPGLSEYVQVKRLDETNAELAMRSPESFRADKGLLMQISGKEMELGLLPYSIVRIDST